jgi:hypothetical protein
MLQQGLKSQPSSFHIQQVMMKLKKRLENPDNTWPLQVLIVGGSVTRGHGCINHDLYNAPNGLNATTCAWPSQLEQLINTMIGMKVVEFYNVAVGATNLDFGTALIKFHLYPESLLPDGPDVIISAYATNEQASHVTDTTTKEWIDEEQQRVEAFIHASQTSTHACKTPPLVLFVDDYLGNRQDYINREMSYSNIVTQLAD